MQITEGKCQKIGKIILLQNKTALFPDHIPAENGGAKCPINCDTYSPGALIHNNFLMILDYFLPLSTKLNKVEFDIYLNKTKAFGAIAPSSVAFHKRVFSIFLEPLQDGFAGK